MVAGPGLLLAFEGVDGCGKSTQIGRMVKWLVAARPERPVTALREPGGTPLGEAVRALLLDGGEITARTETLLYMSARAELYERHVLPALARDEVVLLDRSHYSTAAYQGAGLGVDIERILDLAGWLNEGREPDRVIVLELPESVAMARRGPADRIEQRDLAYFARVAEAFRSLATRWPERFVMIDASGSEDTVAARVLEALIDVV